MSKGGRARAEPALALEIPNRRAVWVMAPQAVVDDEAGGVGMSGLNLAAVPNHHLLQRGMGALLPLVGLPGRDGSGILCKKQGRINSGLQDTNTDLQKHLASAILSVQKIYAKA
ncbi:MAG: hypothetical protein D6768_19585 [Chloroflexi bacterium]|nr:MAG: hypothetical protein D6768_19585 [Chloroflexota bacterium]